MMKRLLLLTISTAVMLSLAGCAGVNARLEDQMVKKSGVLEDPSYQTYEGYVDDGKLDDEGYYADTTSEASDENRGPIHVTFSDNNNLQIKYYADATHQESLDPAVCYLNPGDSIYAVVKVSDEVFSSMYDFAGFRVLANDENGRFGILTPEAQNHCVRRFRSQVL